MVKKWHYLAVKSLFELLRKITSNNNGGFCCLNCFHSYSTKEKLKKHKNLCENHDYCYVETLKKDNKVLKYNYLYDKNNYVVHIRSLQQALNHGLILKKVHKLIQFNH